MNEINTPSKKLRIMSICAVVVLTAIVYSNSLSGEFVWDDLLLIKNNTLIHQGDPSTLFSAKSFPCFRADNPGYFRPVVLLSYWLDNRLFGMNPFWFHLVNLSLHLLCVLLFLFVLRRFFSKLRFEASLLATAIFALHPYHTETVTFISGRTDLLATVFFLLALGEYLEFRERGRVLALYLSLGAFTLGLLSKELLLVFPPALILWELFAKERRDLRGAVVALAPFAVVTALYFPIRALTLGSADLALSGSRFGEGLGSRLFYAPILFARFIYMLVLPTGFNAFRYEEFTRQYTGAVRLDLHSLAGIVGAALIVALFIILVAKVRRDEAFWLGITALGLLPVLNIIPIAAVPLSERFLYLPSLGYAVLAASVITAMSDRLRRKNPKSSIYGLVAVFLILSYSALTYIRNFDWRNELMFYNAMIRTEPLSEQGYSGLAKVYSDMGEHDSVIYYAQKALSLNNNVHAWLLIADVYIFRGEFDIAESALVEAERLSPENSMVQLAQANLEYSRHDYPTARAKYNQIISRWPDFYTAHLNLGRLEYRDCNYSKASEHLEAARRLKPNDPGVHRLLSMVYSNLGENEKARQAWREYLRLPGVKVGDFSGDDDAPGVIPQSMRGR